MNVGLLILGLLDCCLFVVKNFVDFDKLLGNFLLDYVRVYSSFFVFLIC